MPGWVLAVAVVASVGWILKIVYDALAVRDREARALAEAEAEVERRLGVAAQRQGLLPDDPIVLASAAAIEPRLCSLPCPICSGALHVERHEVEGDGADRLRRLSMRCGSCGRRTNFWVRLAVDAIN